MVNTIKQANENIGGLSDAGKMPALSWNIPVEYCDTGSVLIEVEGSACFGCYADNGRYKFSNVKNALENRYQKYLSNRKLWVESVVFILNNSKLMQRVPFFRWFDAGDIIDLQHLSDIYDICRKTPHINHWLPTKEWQHKKQFVNKPENLTIRVSSPFKNKPFKPNQHQTHSVVLTKDEFSLHKDNKESGIYFCPSGSQGGQCQECRACWNENIECIAYEYHGAKANGKSKNLLHIEKIKYGKVA